MGTFPILVVALFLVVVKVKLLSNMSWQELSPANYKGSEFLK